MQTTEQLYGLSFTQGDGLLKFGTDALLLWDFCPPVRGAFTDLCAGTGILGVLLLMKNPAATLTAVEINPDAAALCEKNLTQNHFDRRFRVITGDLREKTNLPEPNSQALIVCNPPYFDTDSGVVSESPEKRQSRFEETCRLSDIAAAARRCLSHRGRLCLCYRPDRLCELLSALSQAGLTPKRLRFVHSQADNPAGLVLCEARKGCAPGLIPEPPLILSNPDGSPSAEYVRIYQL